MKVTTSRDGLVWSQRRCSMFTVGRRSNYRGEKMTKFSQPTGSHKIVFHLLRRSNSLKSYSILHILLNKAFKLETKTLYLSQD